MINAKRKIPAPFYKYCRNNQSKMTKIENFPNLLFLVLIASFFCAHPTWAEPIKLQDLEDGGILKIPQDQDIFYSSPKPMGMGSQDLHQPKAKSLSSKNFTSNNQLFFAIGDDDVEGARSLILSGADPNMKVPGSDMKILMTAQSGAMVKMLVKNGADPKAQDQAGATPLHYLVTSSSALEIAPVLINAGADVNAVAKGAAGADNRTPLHDASHWYFEGNDHLIGERLVRMLIAAGADINAPEYDGKTLLHKAVENEKPDFLRLLLELGADPNRKDNDGLTPLDSAKNLKINRIIRILNENN